MQPENVQNVQNVLDVLDVLDVLNVLNVLAVTQISNSAIQCTMFEEFYLFNCHLPKNMDFIVLAFAASSGAASGSNTLGYSVKVDSHVLALPQQVSLNLLHFLFLVSNIIILKIILNFHNMILRFFLLSFHKNWGMGIADTIFDSMSAFFNLFYQYPWLLVQLTAIWGWVVMRMVCSVDFLMGT